MKQKHLAKLDNCPKDGALQYLITRENKKSWTIFLLHIGKNQVQKLEALTSFPKTALNLHGSSQSGSNDLDTYKKIVSQHYAEELALITKLQNREKNNAN